MCRKQKTSGLARVIRRRIIGEFMGLRSPPPTPPDVRFRIRLFNLICGVAFGPPSAAAPVPIPRRGNRRIFSGIE
jgi:hypothetical protein